MDAVDTAISEVPNAVILPRRISIQLYAILSRYIQGLSTSFVLQSLLQCGLSLKYGTLHDGL